MSTQTTQRPRWDIAHLLDGLTGKAVRVAAKSFSPVPPNGDAPRRFMPVRDLFLPDNSQPASLPVFFEGRLLQFERQIGVVSVHLDSPESPDGASEGLLNFRGETAVILHGPAVVELAFPFQVERLPAAAENYWRDLRVTRAQFEFAFSASKDGPAVGTREPQTAILSRNCAGAID